MLLNLCNNIPRCAMRILQEAAFCVLLAATMSFDSVLDLSESDAERGCDNLSQRQLARHEPEGPFRESCFDSVEVLSEDECPDQAGPLVVEPTPNRERERPGKKSELNLPRRSSRSCLTAKL